MTEDCRRFEASLLELAYGELDEAAAEELRAHAAGCPGCFKALEDIMLTRKLASQLPVMEPGDEMDAPVLAAAAEAVANLGRKEARKDAAEVEFARALQRPPSLADRLKGILLTPALATAAVAALVFVLTFFLWERGAVKREPTLVGAPHSASSVETAPAGAPVVDAKEEQGYLEAEIAEGEPAKDEAATTSSTERTRAAAGNLGTAGPKPVDKPADEPNPFPAVAEQARESKKASAKPDADELDDLLGGSASGGFAKGAGGASPQASAPQAVAPLEEEEAADKVAEADFVKEDSNRDFENGMAAYSRGDCDSAIRDLLKVVDRSPSSLETAYAMHHIARCEKRRGRFAAALPWYEKVLGRFPNYSGRPDALLEAAACHRRLGQRDWARRRLEELSKIPGWEARAEQELELLSE